MGAGLVISTVVATPLMAQDYTNVSASGRVVSTDGQAISGATVAIKSNDQGFERSVTTDSNGSYRIPQLPTGSYTFTISADGYDTFSDDAVNLGSDSSANQFSLVAQGGSGDIVVSGGRLL